jgi:Na+/H+ antiporter NhaD/arsenite permease-like protein
MIVGGDAIEVLSPVRFLLYMIFPSVAVFFITILWIERCWMRERMIANSKDEQSTTAVSNVSLVPLDSKPLSVSVSRRKDASRRGALLSPYKKEKADDLSFDRALGRDDKEEKRTLVSKVVRVIATPFPYAMMLLMAIMIALIFVDVMSISGLICLTAVIMVVILVLGNHWQGQPIWGIAKDGATGDYSTPHKMTSEEKMVNTAHFFEELFDSIDYNLLIIFLGLFVVVENIDSTGLPRSTWNKIVGKTPFDNISSVIGISLFVLATSQFLGNVAVIQLAKPNVEILDEGERRYAWAVISFVATVGGNLTITGSAANIIVAEKAARIDPSSTIDFFKHYRVCFWVTLFSCALGACMITGVVICDNGGLVAW